MTATVVQEVKTVFRAETSGLRREMQRLADSTKGPSAAIGALVSQVQSLQRLAVGGVMGYGVGQLFKGLVQANASAESMQISFATMLQSSSKLTGSFLPFAQAMKVSTGVMEDLRQVAVDTPGTFDQVAGAFKSILMSATAAKVPMKDIVQLAGDLATADISEGGTGLLIRDVSQAMRGGKVDSVYLKPYEPKIKKLVKAGKGQEAFGVIRKAIEMDPAARQAFGKSFDGQVSTFKDRIAEIQRTMGKPIFDLVNSELAQMSAWLKANKEQVMATVKAVGKWLVKAFHAVKDAVSWLAKSGLGEFIIKIWAASKAADMLVSGFKGIGAILSALAKNPFFLAIRLAAAAIGVFSTLMGKVERDPNKLLVGQAKEWVSWDNGKGSGLRLNPQLTGRIGEPLVPNFPRPVGMSHIGATEAAKLFLKADEQRQKALSFIPIALAEEANQKRVLEETMMATAEEAFRRAQLGGTKVDVDARGSKITVNTELKTDDPGRFANASVKGAFMALVRRPMSATFGFGAPAVSR